MSNTTFEPGDIKILSLKITNTNKTSTVDIRAQAVSFSIFEDIEQPTIYAEFVINDAINLVKDLPIIGEEDIEVSFIVHGRDEITTYKLRTFTVTSTSTSNNSQSSNYILKCVSKDHFTNAVQQIDKAYKCTVAEMVVDILQNGLDSKTDVTVEATRGLVPIAIPRMNPYQAVDFLRQKAIAKRPSGGVFVFFENQYGYNFVSLEKLIEDGKKTIKSKVFQHYPDVQSDKNRQTHSFRSITKMEQLTKFDTVNKMMSGMFKNQVISFDMLSKKVGTTDFKLHEQARVFETGEKKAEIPNTEKIIKEANAGSPYYMFAPKDSSKGNDYISDLMGYRHSFASLFNQNIVRCVTYGDNYLTVGDMIEIKLPDVSGTTEKKNGDDRFSGNYMITKLRHMVYQSNKKFKYEIVMDCNKIGFNA